MRTRAELTRELSLARGTATVLVRDLADRNLIEELQIPADEAVHRSRGRPTGVPSPHPDGPVALAVDLRDDSFSIASFELTGRGTILERQERAVRLRHRPAERPRETARRPPADPRAGA